MIQYFISIKSIHFVSNICLLIFTLLINETNAQFINYFENNPVWEVVNIDGHTRCLQSINSTFFIKGDSMINGVTYKKIFKTGINETMAPPKSHDCDAIEHHFSSPYPFAYLRQEQKKIIQYNLTTQHDSIVNDFDIKVGDTLFKNYIDTLFIVTSIDSIKIGEEFRSRFILNNNNNLYIIDGVGGWYGFLNPVIYSSYDSYNLLSYTFNNNTIKPTKKNEETSVGIIDYSKNKKISIAPNPAFDYILLPTDVKQINSFTIFDIKGYVIMNCKVLDYRIDISSIPTGIYFIKITNNESIFFQRFIKIL